MCRAGRGELPPPGVHRAEGAERPERGTRPAEKSPWVPALVKSA